MTCKVLLCLVCLVLPPGQLPCLLISSSTIPSSASRTSCLLAFAWDVLNPPVFSWKVITNPLHFSLNVTSLGSHPWAPCSPCTHPHSTDHNYKLKLFLWLFIWYIPGPVDSRFLEELSEWSRWMDRERFEQIQGWMQKMLCLNVCEDGQVKTSF